MKNIVQIAENDNDPATEKIIDPSRIALLLEQLSKHYSPLIVQIQGRQQRYACCIVDVNKPYVLFDQLMPETGHQHLLEVRKIRASGRLNGVEISFNTTLEHVIEQDNLLSYQMKLPTTLKYRQRRSAYRVRIPYSMQLRVLIDNGGDVLVNGQLHDLSHGGAGKIMADGKFELNIAQLYECAIELPCGEWIFCTVETCYLKDVPARKRRLIGASFVDLTARQSRVIGRCISELELKQMQSRSAS